LHFYFYLRKKLFFLKFLAADGAGIKAVLDDLVPVFISIYKNNIHDVKYIP